MLNSSELLKLFEKTGHRYTIRRNEFGPTLFCVGCKAPVLAVLPKDTEEIAKAVLEHEEEKHSEKSEETT